MSSTNIRRQTVAVRCAATMSAVLLGGLMSAAWADHHGAHSHAGAAHAEATSAELQGVIAGSWRSDANRARDRYRHPAETLTFFKVSPRDTLIEITPGQGWYAEILAPLLKPQGHYVAAVQAPALVPVEQREYQQRNRDKLLEKFKADAERYGAAKVVEFDPKKPVLGEPNSADVVVTFRNVHNWIQNGTDKAFFAAFYDVLKPGGVLGVVDHRAPAGSEMNPASGYIPEDYVIKLATDVGFTLDAKSEVNANPRDTKDYPKGVWTLPPVLRLADVDREKYMAIGESDRFTLRFVKPEAAQK